MPINLSATICAVFPLIPVSISSKIIVSISSSPASIDLIASIILDNSPPEATFAKDFTSSPGFVEIKNSTSSCPLADTFSFFDILILNLTDKKFKSSRALTTVSSSFIAYFLRRDESLSHNTTNSLISLSNFVFVSSLIKL